MEKKQVKITLGTFTVLIISIILLALAVGACIYLIGNRTEINFEDDVVTIAKIKSIEPTKMSNGILDNTSEFLITAEESVDLNEIKKAIYVEPALEYNITKTGNENEYKLTFKQNIPDNTILKLQYVKNKITEDSWAYQTKNELSVTSTFPYQNSWINENNVIEIEFSYGNVESIEEFVEIQPATDGTWEHKGKIWRFTPSQEWKAGEYNLKIKSGLAAGEQKLKEDFVLKFRTSGQVESTYSTESITVDKIRTYKPDEAVRIYGNIEKETAGKVEIYRFNNQEEFIKYLDSRNYKNAQNLGEYKFAYAPEYLQLEKTLGEGYYTAVISTSKGKIVDDIPIQVNSLSAYALETERDVLVWVANGNDLAKDINVEYLGKTEKTDSQGIAKFQDVTDNSKKVKYLTVGNNDNKLIVGILNSSFDNYNYSYLYTDRPLYKNTDTIKVWGFVPKKLLYDKIEDEFYIQFGEGKKEKIAVDEDGILSYEYNIKNHKDGYASIILYYKDSPIAYRGIEVERYELQNYTFETSQDKDYVFDGENFDFAVKVKHITGLNVPNKKITAVFEGINYSAITGEDGVAHFSIPIKIPAESRDNSTDLRGFGISIYNGDALEYSSCDTYVNINVVNRKSHTEFEEENDKYKITLYKVKANDSKKIDYDLKNIYDGPYKFASVRVDLVEYVYTRYVSGQRYNEYTKETEPEYSYRSDENKQNVFAGQVDENGVVEINRNDIKQKKSTEEISYSYSLRVSYVDTDGKTVEDDRYITDSLDYGSTRLGFVRYSWINFEDIQINNGKYFIYRYFLKYDEDKKYKIGDTIDFKLGESTEAGLKEIDNEGKLLQVAFKERINSQKIITDNNISYKFEDKDFPGTKITTAYFLNGKFYRMPVYYLDFDEEERKVDIEITSDKKEYKPGDEVTLNIKTTNQGKGIKTAVNVSVVNKSIFELESDSTNLLDTVYDNKEFFSYTYSTYRDYIDTQIGDGNGGGDDDRDDFEDTAYFETVKTNNDGNATVKFKLPDNVTTYTATVHSANKDLYLGVNKLEIVSKLDFFVQSIEPRGVKTADDLVLNATSVAEEIYPVEYEFTIKELNKTMKATANTNSLATVNFGKLPYGTYTAVIRGKGNGKEDGIEYKFNIVESAQEVSAKIDLDIAEKPEFTPVKMPVTLEIYNKEMKQYIKYMEFIETNVANRLDVQIASREAQKLKNQFYGEDVEIATVYADVYNQYGGYSNLRNGSKDLVLTSLINYYAKEYAIRTMWTDNEDNLFELYLEAAANGEPVLTDILYLKEIEDTDNYNKLLVTLSLEFLGDFKNAKELYGKINLTQDEKQEYKSLIAIIDTFINKKQAVEEINALIEERPSDEYLRFAILSFFKNNSRDFTKEETVTITSANKTETIKLKGMEIKKYTLYDADLGNIKFETDSKDLRVTYYYEGDFENLNAEENIQISVKPTEGNEVNLHIKFPNDSEGYVRIALPNSLRLVKNYRDSYYSDNGYYLTENKIHYITLFKRSNCYSMDIPLIILSNGNYKFEPIVLTSGGKYYISNALDLNIGE